MTKINKEFSDTVGIKDAVSLKTRKDLFMSMYKIAKEHRDLAKQVASNDIKDMPAETDKTMISILFSYTCLEAYINTIGEDILRHDWQRFKDKRIEAKWRGVSNFLATKKFGKPHSVFSKDDEPFKSFLELKKIREDYIVHRPAHFGDFVQTKYGNTDGTINVLNCDNAEWACKVVKDMVKNLCDNIENPPSTDWLK